MDHEKLKKIEVGVAICLLLVGALTFFSYPSITGHVSSDLNTQLVDFMIDESQLFEITTDSVEPFFITSFRISGVFIGNGIVEAYLDNGRGQQILIYDNIREKKADSGLGLITGGVIGEEVEFEEVLPEKTLRIKPAEVLSENIKIQLKKGEETFSGEFDSQCIESCFIEMEMAQDVGYNLIFRVESGTKVHLTKIQYTIRD